ncbi:MAG: Gfo/Idh/MocA family protein [Longimicrobiales bacterium]
MIRAAIVGLGRWGRNLVSSVQGKSEHLQFTHTVVRRPADAREFAAKHGIELAADYGRVLADTGVQAIVLTTPHSLHTEQIVAAADAGKPVFCEKPLALARADAERSIEACRRAGVPLGLGYNKRFWPSMRELKRIVAGGELGEIQHVEGHFSNETTGRHYTGWRGEDAESPAGGLTATGVHVLDAFMDLAGPARLVQARLTARASTGAPLDTLSVFIEFRNRASGVLCGVRSTPQFWRVHVFGTEGSAEALEDTDLMVRRMDTAPRRLNFERVDSLRLELEAFARAVETGAPYPIPFEQMLDGVSAFEAIVQSIAEARPIDLQ